MRERLENVLGGIAISREILTLFVERGNKRRLSVRCEDNNWRISFDPPERKMARDLPCLWAFWLLVRAREATEVLSISRSSFLSLFNPLEAFAQRR